VSLWSPDEVRRCYSAAAEGFVEVVSGIGDDSSSWDRPGLGVWTVRDLVGHASRSLSVIEQYLAEPAVEIRFATPLDYLAWLSDPSLDHASVAWRGRAAGEALGSSPAAAVRELAARATALVAATPDEATLTTAFGGTTFMAYLPTRTFELTVHTLDLVSALGVEAPPVLDAPVAACLELAVAAAAAGRGTSSGEAGGASSGGAVLLALTGRRGLPPGFSVV
jgi:uncharacterized protein (TIGR03083 family)